MAERKEFLTDQIITYLGNKRSLLDFIDNAVSLVKEELGVERLTSFDVFAGSGVVSRYLKQHSSVLYTNDLEDYCCVINKCYLTNENEINQQELEYWFNYLKNRLDNEPLYENGFIYRLYAPQDDENIQAGERVFYTSRNAKYLDTARQYLDEVPEPYKTLLLAPLLYEASTKNNTSGVFKGFYKNSQTKIGQFGGDGRNALKRILADIEVKKPILSMNSSEVHVLQGDSNQVCRQIPHVDLAYMDPPYNQHPYSSNYFMLNLLTNYEEPAEISNVSGIPVGWNKSSYNKKTEALNALADVCRNVNATYVLISYNSEGFITFDEMVNMLDELGYVRVFDQNYNVFRGCRNLRDRDIHVTEYLFLLRKDG